MSPPTVPALWMVKSDALMLRSLVKVTRHRLLSFITGLHVHVHVYNMHSVFGYIYIYCTVYAHACTQCKCTHITFTFMYMHVHVHVHTGQQLFYSCPAVREGVAGICEHQCSLHSECPHSQKCCYNGCGHTCQSPVTIPYVLLSEATSCPSPNEVPCLRQEGTMGSCRDPQFACNEGEICCDNGCSSAVCLSLSNLTPCYTAKRVLLGNSTAPLLGAYRPRCESDGRFKEIQCHEHYCWCVENSTGRPRTDMVPFEKIGSLECSSKCLHTHVHVHYYRLHCTSDATCTCVHMHNFKSSVYLHVRN